MAEPARVVEVRCPAGPHQLLTKLRLADEQPRYLQPDNLIELACDNCRRPLRRRPGYQGVARVLHRYNFLGELVSTVAVDADGIERFVD